MLYTLILIVHYLKIMHCPPTLVQRVYISGVSTVGPSGACAPLTFSLLINFIKQVAYFSCSLRVRGQ